MTFEDVKIKCVSGDYKLIDAPRRIPDHTILDENRTVKWNREEVQRQNQDVVIVRNEVLKKNNETWNRFKQDLYDAAYSEYELNRNQFEALYNFVMVNITEYDWMCESFVSDLEDFIDFFFSVVNLD